jgi:hypothetical protein
VALAIMTAIRTMCNMRHVLDVIAYPCFPTFARVLSIIREIEDTIVVWFKSIMGSWERDANWILKIYVMI